MLLFYSAWCVVWAVLDDEPRTVDDRRVRPSTQLARPNRRVRNVLWNV